MFTGIVEGTAPVLAVRPRGGGARIVVELGPLADGVKIGDSVALSGCCLTVVELREGVASFDAIPETLSRTWLGRLRAGDRVNVERSLRAGDRLGGHLVQGHIDGLARIVARREEGGGAGGEGAQVVFELEAPRALTDDMVEKGSIALDGVSLTLTAAEPERFAVALIPHTLAVTTFGGRREGDEVNVETDVIGKWVRRLVEPYVTKK